jgi:hypothetical protein
MEIFPGYECLVFDIRSQTFMPAVVQCRYGFVSEYMTREYGIEAGRYPDCVDVIFKHDNRLSKGHFTECIRRMNICQS